MPINAIFVLEPNGQSLLSLLGTLAPPGGHFPGTPHWLKCFDDLQSTFPLTKKNQSLSLEAKNHLFVAELI